MSAMVSYTQKLFFFFLLLFAAKTAEKVVVQNRDSKLLSSTLSAPLLSFLLDLF